MRQDLPVLKTKEVVAALEMADFEVRRHTGSHVIMYKSGIRRPISITTAPRRSAKGDN